MIENSLRQRFRVFATFKVFIGHHHRALFPHATTSVDFELRHRLTKQIDYQTLKKMFTLRCHFGSCSSLTE